MQGTTLYIILGLLVSAVVIFLFVSSLLDRKKRKKIEAQEKIKIANQKSANMKIAIAINFILHQNELLLKQFVPSVGVFKMSDIRKKARQSLDIIERSKPYSFLKSDETLIVTIISKLKSHNSNIWSKKFPGIANIITTMSLANHKLRTNDLQVKALLKRIKKVYTHDITK